VLLREPASPGDFLRALLLLVHFEVELLHRGVVELPRQQAERVANFWMRVEQLGADDRRRLIGREEPAIVAERLKFVRRDSPVGRERADDIDLAVGDGLIHEPRIEVAYLREIEPVGLS
jgi:hypothetical protein